MIKYFDNSATTRLDENVLKEMIPYLVDNYANPSAIYSIGKNNKEAITLARMRVAECINANVNEIYFTSGGSESDNLAIKGIAFANSKFGKHIITTSFEHPAVLNTCKFLERFGFKTTYIRPKSNGIIDPKDIERAITRNTILISVMFVNNEIGTIQPIKEIGEIAKKHGIYFHTDSVQAMGNVKIDVKEMNISSLSMSSHKFYGPKGVGVLYMKSNVNFIRMQDGGHQEKNMRAGTENVAGIIGTGKALQIATDNLEEHQIYLSNLRNYCLKELKKKIPTMRVNGDMENRVAGNLNVSFPGVDGAKLLEELDKRDICVSSGSACSAGLIQASPVLLEIGVPMNIAKSSLRITLGKYNTIDEVNELIKALEEIIN